MRKILLVLAALFAMTSVNAQEEGDALVSLLKLNFEGAVPKYLPTGDNPMEVEATADGLALTHASTSGSFSDHMIQITDDCLTLQMKHNYVVRMTVKVPHKDKKKDILNRDCGYLGIQLGNAKSWTQTGIFVKGGDDFQVVDFEIPHYPHNIEGDGCIILNTHNVLGTSVLKDVEVFEAPTDPESPVIGGMKLIGEQNWENKEYIVFDGPEGVYKSTAEGLAINNPVMQEYIYTPQTCVVNDFDLKQGFDYIVRLTLKVPSDGTYNVIMGNYVHEVPVKGSDSWQVIDVIFSDFGEETADGTDHSMEDVFVNLGSGWVVGTTVVKQAEVYEVVGSGARGTTAIQGVKASAAGDAVYNLAGQKVDASYKGIVIQNGKKRIVR